jgi:hypothetical protein
MTGFTHRQPFGECIRMRALPDSPRLLRSFVHAHVSNERAPIVLPAGITRILWAQSSRALVPVPPALLLHDVLLLTRLMGRPNPVCAHAVSTGGRDHL